MHPGEHKVNYEIQDFDADVIQRSHALPVLVDFWAGWCGPCRVLSPVLEHLAEQNHNRWALVKVDTDAHQDLAARYGVRGIPNVKLFVDGKVANEFTGALPERAVVQWLEGALPDPFRREIERARQLLAQGSVQAAQEILRGILQKAGSHEQARVLLAGTLLWTDRDRARSLVAGIEEHSEHYAAADAITTILALCDRLQHPETLPAGPSREDYLEGIRGLADGNFEAAVRGFLKVIRSDRYYDDDGARKACVAIFRILGDDHEITRQYRREFSSALYA